MHMVAARLGCKSTMVGATWANSCPGCMDRLSERYSHFVGGSFLPGKVASALSRCLTTRVLTIACSEWAWLRSQVCMLRLKVDLGSILESRAWTEMEIWCVKVFVG